MNMLGGIDILDLKLNPPFFMTETRTVEMSIGGREIHHNRSRSNIDIQLEGDSDSAWFNPEQLGAIFELLNTQGWTGPLIYNGTEYKVRFRNEETDPITFTPVTDWVQSSDTETRFSSVVIKLKITP